MRLFIQKPFHSFTILVCISPLLIAVYTILLFLSIYPSRAPLRNGVSTLIDISHFNHSVPFNAKNPSVSDRNRLSIPSPDSFTGLERTTWIPRSQETSRFPIAVVDWAIERLIFYILFNTVFETFLRTSISNMTQHTIGHLSLSSAILFTCLFASPALSQVFANASLARANVTSNTTSTLINAEPVGIKLSLPWWTSIPSAVIGFFIAFKSLTFDWDKGVELTTQMPKKWRENRDLSESRLSISSCRLQVFAGHLFQASQDSSTSPRMHTARTSWGPL